MGRTLRLRGPLGRFGQFLDRVEQGDAPCLRESGERAGEPIRLEHGVGGHAPLPFGGEDDREPALVARVTSPPHEAAALEVLDDLAG